jgi:hypothetical protein
VSVVRVETLIEAPPQVCFDTARDVGLHARSAAATGERVVGGTAERLAEGLLGLGDEVTFEARHLGLRQRLTARITRFESPRLFVDEQVRGALRSFVHTHEFRPAGPWGDSTIMVDTLAPQFQCSRSTLASGGSVRW